MMILFYTDPHHCCKAGNKNIFTQQMKFYTEQMFPFILENNVTDVCCCGDFMDDRNKVDIYILQELKDKFFTFFANNKVNLHLLVGNHDVHFSNTLSHHVYKATGIDLLKNVFVYDSIQTIEIGKLTIGMIPWQVEPNETKFPKADLLCLHSEMRGFCFAKGVECKHGYEVDDFKYYKYIFNGHLHLNYIDKNVVNIGNPYQKDWGDLSTIKCFYCIDERFNLTHHENIVSPRHINISYDDITDDMGINTFELRSYGLGMNDVVTNDMKKLDIVTDLCKNNYTKLIISSGSNQKRIDKIYSTMIESSGEGFTPSIINTTQIVSNVDKDKMEAEIKEDSDVIGNMRLYTESVTLKDDIDKELLVEMFEEIYKETVIGAM